MSKPKNFSEALEELEKFADGTSEELKTKLESELNELEQKIQRLKPKLENLRNSVEHEFHNAKGKLEDQVKEKPWTTIGLVGLIFFIVGFLVAGRRPGNSD